MNRDEQEDTTIYRVVVNHEEQYSIWPVDRETPLGWRDAGNRQDRPNPAIAMKTKRPRRPLRIPGPFLMFVQDRQ